MPGAGLGSSQVCCIILPVKIFFPSFSLFFIFVGHWGLGLVVVFFFRNTIKIVNPRKCVWAELLTFEKAG